MSKIQNSENHPHMGENRIYGYSLMGERRHVVSELVLPCGDCYQLYTESVWGTTGGIGKTIHMAENGKTIHSAVITDQFDRRKDDLRQGELCALIGGFSRSKVDQGGVWDKEFVRRCQQDKGGLCFEYKFYRAHVYRHHCYPCGSYEKTEHKLVWEERVLIDLVVCTFENFSAWCKEIEERHSKD